MATYDEIMASQKSYWSDPLLRGWRANMARVARKHAAITAADRREQTRRRRLFEAQMQYIIDSKGGKK